MADLEKNKNNGEECLNEGGFKFPEGTKDKDIVPFDKKKSVEEDKVNGESNLTGMQDAPSNAKSPEQIEDDGDVGEYVSKTDLDAFQQYIENAVKSSIENIKSYQESLEIKVKEKIEEKIKTSTEGPIESVEEKISDIKNQLEKYKEAYDKQLFRTVEIVGVFSSVVALLVVNAGVVHSADTFLKASILIAGLSSVIVIFASLIHFFFNANEKRKPGVSLIVPLCILICLLIAGLIVEFVYGGAYKSISSSEKDNISVESRVEQSFSDFHDYNMTVDSSKNAAKDSVKK